MNTRVCYTCITGEYDSLKPIRVKTPGWDYICFTNHKLLTSRDWQIKYIDNPENLDNVRLARQVKIQHYKYLQGYTQSLWVDGNLMIMGEFLFSRFQFMRHAQRRCVYEEAQACIRLKKDSSFIINKQISRYRQEGLPINVGMINSSVISRPVNDEKVNKLMDYWWEEVLHGSRRDQLSFNYVMWKHPSLILPDYGNFNKKIFRKLKHIK